MKSTFRSLLSGLAVSGLAVSGLAVCSLAVCGLAASASAQPAPKTVSKAPRHWKSAPTPPLGWNSWDCFATTLTEAQAKAETDYIAQNLKKHGWRYLTVDIQWYEPNATGFGYRRGAVLTMDQNGRLLPSPNKFPSAADGKGFKALADYVHGKGLKFGIHLMRGIPRQAIAQNVPILGTTTNGTPVRAADIADQNSICEWNSDMFGVDMTKPGAQAYYDSVFAQIAGWGVDLVKVDDLSRPYHQAEIEAIRAAIDRTGRPMVLSTSPGETPLASASHVAQNANMWRISDDFWDTWPLLMEQFERAKNWAPVAAPGHFPDADMLPLGAIRQVGGGPAWTRFTKDEQVTMMTLWSMMRSPLIMGGDLLKNDAWTLSLLQNDAVIAVDQHSQNGRELFKRDGFIGWTAEVPGSKDKYLALFNTRDPNRLREEAALFKSGLVTRDTPGHSVPIDVDVTGATKLYLMVDDGGDGTNADHADWVAPRLLGPNGEQKLTDLGWNTATSGWNQVVKDKSVEGTPMSVNGAAVASGIGAHANSLIEFDVPPGVTRFRASAALDDSGTNQARGATARFWVFTSAPYDSQPAAPVPVALREIGFTGAAQVRDLWSGAKLGTVRDNFAPSIAAHGAGLYRVSASK